MIRHAVQADIPQVLANGRTFSEAAYPEVPYDADSFIHCVKQMMSDGLLIIAEEDGIHLGGVGAVSGPIEINHSLKGASEKFWWVKPDQRAAGVGGALMVAFEDACRNAGCYSYSMIALHDVALPIVDGFYKKSGLRLAEHIYMKVL